MRSTALRPLDLRRSVLPAHEIQLAYLTQSARLEESASPRLVKLTAILISVSILAFVGWAAQTNINEIARSAGEIVPYGYEQSVQHLDGGRVAEIFTSEGAMVEAGEVLLQLEGVGTEEDLARSKRKQLSLDLRRERLRAFIDGRELDFSAFAGVDQGEIDKQAGIFAAMKAATFQKAAIVDEQLVQREQAIEVLKVRRSALQKSLGSLSDLLAKRRGLFRKGHLTRVQLLDTEQRVNALTGEIATVEEQLKQAQGAVAEYKSRRTAVGASQLDEAYRELDLLTNEAAQNAEVIKKLERATDRLQVRAPVRGVVKGLGVNTIGAVVQPGQRLLDIVPLGKDLIVETRISPQHIGHIEVGQPVEVKVSAYDVSRYGSIRGKLAFISATTFAGEEGRRYYRGQVRLSQDHAGSDPEKNRILPGMTAMVEIITGEKTILEYLLKPVTVAVNSAFSER
jgi:membrane fusion protein, adhesin transport system